MVTFFRGLPDGAPIGEWELHRVCVCWEAAERRVLRAWCGAGVPLDREAHDLASDLRYMGTLVLVCAAAWCAVAGVGCDQKREKRGGN